MDVRESHSYIPYTPNQELGMRHPAAAPAGIYLGMLGTGFHSRRAQTPPVAMLPARDAPWHISVGLPNLDSHPSRAQKPGMAMRFHRTTSLHGIYLGMPDFDSR